MAIARESDTACPVDRISHDSQNANLSFGKKNQKEGLRNTAEKYLNEFSTHLGQRINQVIMKRTVVRI